jgi:hypothetical protein
MRLDMRSKDVGLFPQASKVQIHRIGDIDAELKQISSPVETVLNDKLIDQKALQRRLKELSVRDRIVDVTRFKYLLGCATPHSSLNGKLIRIAKSRPDLVANVMRYFRRYESLPQSVADSLLEWLGEPPLYPATSAEIVETLSERIGGPTKVKFLQKLDRMWKPTQLDASLMAVIGSVLLTEGTLSPSRANYAVLNAPEWWTKARLIEALTKRHFSEAWLENILNVCIRNSQPDVALAAAYRMIEENISMVPGTKPIHPIAHDALKLFGKAKGRPANVSGIEIALHEFLGVSTKVDWKKIFKTNHNEVEQQALLAFTSAKVNASAFVNGADVFDDWLADALHNLNPTMGKYKLGNLTWAANPTTKFSKIYPATQKVIAAIHGWRYASPYSHAQESKTKSATKPLPFRVIGQARRMYKSAFHELSLQFPA